MRDGQGVFRLLDAAADDRIDIDMKVGVLCQVAQLLVEHPQALPGNFIRLNVVDADLQRIKSRFIQPLDAVRREVIAVRDQTSDHALGADVPDD